MTNTVLVTGGAGFIARWCIVELLQQGHQVRTTLRDLAKAPQVRAGLGEQASKVPTRTVPDFAVRLLALFTPPMRVLLHDLGRRNWLSTAKPRRLLSEVAR